MPEKFHSMCCTVCVELHIGETDRPVEVRFAEDYCDAKAMDVNTDTKEATMWTTEILQHCPFLTIQWGTDSRETFLTTITIS